MHRGGKYHDGLVYQLLRSQREGAPFTENVRRNDLPAERVLTPGAKSMDNVCMLPGSANKKLCARDMRRARGLWYPWSRHPRLVGKFPLP